MPSSTALYTDLSGYYDLMCADINYQQQSQGIDRLQQFFGNGGKRHLDLACGTGPHLRHFLDAGYQCHGLDLHQPMLDIASQRCPEASFLQQNMCNFQLTEPVDLITCFLYSLHYSGSISQLQACLASVYAALTPAGLFCFNAVDKDKIDNQSRVRHSLQHQHSQFVFESGWYYPGQGEQQALQLNISKTTATESEQWQDSHPMVAVSFSELQQLLQPLFEVQMLEHDYEKIVPWDQQSGNALVVCIKK